MMLQLNPMIPLMTPMGKGFALAICDYSQEHDCLWVVADDATGEIWWWPNDQVRMQKNISMKRLLKPTTTPSPSSPTSPPSRLV